MKEHVEFIVDSFVDYKGIEHHFVIAALSQNLPTKSGKLENNPTDSDDLGVCHEVGVYIQDYGTEDYLNTVTKVLKIGVAICNPTDTFDEKAGSLRAISRAEKAKPTLFASHSGLINSEVVQAILKQEAKFLKENPECFIKGYAESRKRYELNKEMEAMKSGFTDLENQVVEVLDKDPKFLDNAFKYLEWLRNQRKGKCGK